MRQKIKHIDTLKPLREHLCRPTRTHGVCDDSCGFKTVTIGREMIQEVCESGGSRPVVLWTDEDHSIRILDLLVALTQHCRDITLLPVVQRSLHKGKLDFLRI